MSPIEEGCVSVDERAGRTAVTDPFGSASRVLAVCAHPDDESFGLGAVLAAMVAGGAEIHVLCLTRGEASTLRAHPADDLARIRTDELAAAAEVLGVAGTTLLDHPDGGLAELPASRLVDDVAAVAAVARPDLLLTFGPDGVTGHDDHRRATQAAVRYADGAGLPVLAWVVPADVAGRLNVELGAGFTGWSRDRIDLAVTVDRRAQERAIACHRSQERDNPVLRRRLQLLGDREHLVWLRR